MNQTDNNNGSKSLSSYQRRTQSVDEYSLQNLNDGYNEINNKHINGILNKHKHEFMKQISEDDYVCAPLPRTNNRPSAQTCW